MLYCNLMLEVALLKKWIFNTVALILILGLTVVLVFRGQDLPALWEMLKTASIGWIAAAVGLVVAFILSESVIIHLLLRQVKTPARLHHCFFVSFTGFFFSCVTPSASGGQPMQAWLMKRCGVPVSVSVPVLVVVTLLYKAVLVLVGGVVLLWQPAALEAYLRPIYGWCWLGWGLNVAFVAFTAWVLVRPDAVSVPAGRIAAWVANRRHRDPQVAVERVEAWVSKYRAAAHAFSHSAKTLAVAFGITVVQRLFLFAVTVCACLAFGVAEGQLAAVLVVQAMISVAVDMLPLPGGSGISEALFSRAFAALLGEMTLPVLVVSRGIGFYVQMLLGAVLTAIGVLVIRPVAETPTGEKERVL